MFQAMQSDEFWLLLVNAVLALVTLVCVAVIGKVAYGEILERRKMGRWLKRLDDDHAFNVSELGVTMADGGKRVDPAAPAAPPGAPAVRLFVTQEGLAGIVSPEGGGEGHIFRSEN
jgi:hypothetical protein